jgi:anti-sigma B factor antagonist
MTVQFATRHTETGITVIDFTGQLTLGNRLVEAEHEIREHIRQGAKKLVLDLTKLTFLDSAGIGVLAVCSGAMTRSGGRLVIAVASGKIKDALELTRLDKMIELYPDLASACAALA